MICDHCYHRSNCEEIPDKKGRCRNYLKDGEISYNNDFKFNPTDTMEYDYDVIKRALGVKSSNDLL